MNEVKYYFLPDGTFCRIRIDEIKQNIKLLAVMVQLLSRFFFVISHSQKGFPPFVFSRQMSKFIHFTSICHMILTKFLIFTIIHKLIQNQVSVLFNFEFSQRDLTRFYSFQLCDFMTSFCCLYFSLSDFFEFFSFHNNKLTII